MQRGLDVIVIDPRRTETAHHAAMHLAVKPGEDPTLLAGMVRLIIDEELYDRDFVAANAARLEQLRAAVEPFTLEYVARRTGVAAADVAAAARRFARGPRGAAVAGTGPNMAPHPLATEMLVCALNTLCGRYGRAGRRGEPRRGARHRRTSRRRGRAAATRVLGLPRATARARPAHPQLGAAVRRALPTRS